MLLPTGTLTFLFTDIEGSTKLWEAHPEAMRTTLARHDALLRTSIESNGGRVFKTVGDAFCAVFSLANDALAATVAAQRSLHQESWPESVPIHVRMSLHSGAAEERDSDYFGPALNRVARLLSVAHGGQILVSGATHALIQDHLPAGVGLTHLGIHRLKDLDRAEQVYQVLHPDLPNPFPPLRSLNNTPNNLPQQLTSFIGRESQVEEIGRLLQKVRLLTLTGAGGNGKTRLALQVAAELLEGYPDGVWFVELAPLCDPALIQQTVATVLGIREQAGQSILQTLLNRLQPRRLLILLDNCEHLLAECATLTANLLRSCPNISILATSREPLGIAGEMTYRVPSLSLPAQQGRQVATIESVNRCEAARLFVERALLVRPDFAVTSQNAPALAQVCHRLDGIPLALELAAARMRSLSIEEINTRLDSRFRLLTGGDRTALPRQRTLQALVDWSYDLLNEPEKRLLARLSVFAGGWTMSAAEAVCGYDPIEDWETLDLLTSLTDKSLVLMETGGAIGGETRYRMLETLRQYGAEKLEAFGETNIARDRHRDWCLALAEEAEPHLWGPDQIRWLDRLGIEYDNMRAALAWSMTETPVVACHDTALEISQADKRMPAGLRLAVALFFFWATRGSITEGREHLARGLDLLGYICGQELPADGRSAAAANALKWLGTLASLQGDDRSSQLMLEESLAIFRESEHLSGMATVSAYLANLAIVQGDHHTARTLFEESLALAQEVNDTRSIAYSLNSLGVIAQEQGKYDTARALYGESLSLRRELGDKYPISVTLLNLSGLEYTEGDRMAAWSLFKEALILKRELGETNGIVGALEACAIALSEESKERDAVVLWGLASQLREQLNVPIWPRLQAYYESALERTRHTLGTEEFVAAWDQGRSLPWEQAVAWVLGETALAGHRSA